MIIPAVWVASTTLRAASPMGVQSTIIVRFGIPGERDEVWWCRFEITGREELTAAESSGTRAATSTPSTAGYALTLNQSREIAGSDALQALTRAIACAGRVLAGFVAAGGRPEEEDGGAFSIETRFPSLASTSRTPVA